MKLLKSLIVPLVIAGALVGIAHRKHATHTVHTMPVARRPLSIVPASQQTSRQTTQQTSDDTVVVDDGQTRAPAQQAPSQETTPVTQQAIVPRPVLLPMAPLQQQASPQAPPAQQAARTKGFVNAVQQQSAPVQQQQAQQPTD